MSKSRWLVRALILAAVGIVLALKLYFLIFVVDFFIGLYSFVTTAVLFSILLLAYTRFKDPYFVAQEKVVLSNSKPLVSVIVPAKKRGGQHKGMCSSLHRLNLPE